MKTILFYFKSLNKKIIYLQVLITFIILLILPFGGKAQTFTVGNLAILQEASSNNTTGTILEVSPNTAVQSTPVNTYNIPGTGTNALRFSGSAATTGYLATSNDGTLLCFTGANSTNTSSNSNTLNPRGVGTLNNSYTFSLPATYTGTSGNQPRGATTLDNSTYYFADQGGFYSNGTSTASPVLNIRCVKSFGGTVYAFTALATNASVCIISSPTGGTLSGLTGLPNGTTSNQDFYLISSGSNGSNYDVLYILTASSATVGTIYKYSLVSGSWTANGTYTTTFGGFGMCAAKSGAGAYLYITSGAGGTLNNFVIKLTDAAGYNTNINITTANNVTLYTASATATLKGIAFAPQLNAPVVSTGTTSNINITSATCSGNVISNSGSAILKRGICYNTSSNPDTNSNILIITGTTGTFSANLSGLNANTTYHYRAFAQNAIGVTYGADSTFTTLTSLVPTKLAITSINNGNTISANTPFNVTIQAQDITGTPKNTTSNVKVMLSSNGTLGGTTFGYITAGTNGTTIQGVTLAAGSNITISAIDSANVLESVTSSSFTVLQAASKLMFNNLSNRVVINQVLNTFTVQALRTDNTLDSNFTANITLNLVTGSGNLLGTLTKPAVYGIATFNDIYFDQAGSYQINASSTGLTPTSNASITVTPPPQMIELVVPQYIGCKNAASSNLERTPFSICLQFENLQPDTVYDLRAQFGLLTDTITASGAGNTWDDTTFSTNNISHAFTTDDNGNSQPVWIICTTTGNATRFDAGQVHSVRVGYAKTGNTIPSAPAFIGTKTITALDIAPTARTTTTTDDGAFLKGTADSTASGKYVLLFDNVDGTGDPLCSYQIRQTTATQTTQTDLPRLIDSVYMQAGTTHKGDYAVIIPIGANNPNGIRRIEDRNADNTIFSYNTSSNGIWQSGANTTTVNRLDSIIITATDAPLTPFTSKTLNVTAMLQGYYISGSPTMNQAQDVDAYGNNFNKWQGTAVDTLTVQIRSTIGPDYMIEQQFSGSYINTDGTITLSGSVPYSITGYQYIVIKHWESVETWSDSVDFTPNVVNYNFFTNAPSTQFTNNMTNTDAYGTPVDGNVIWAGDVTNGNDDVLGEQDGYVTLDDVFMIYNANLIILTGYNEQDINGDGYVTLDDVFLAYNNNLVLAQTVNPITLNSKKK